MSARPTLVNCLGTAWSYQKGCRCEQCTEAQRIKRRRSRDRARAANSPSYQRELAGSRALKESYRGTCVDCGVPTSWGRGQGPSVRCNRCYRALIAFKHGTNSGYTQKCRCEPCRVAHRDYMRAYFENRRREHGVLKRRWRTTV